MRFRFDFAYRAVLAALFLAAGWAVWAQTGAPANAPAGFVSTDAPPAAPPKLGGPATNQLQALTFGLDQIRFLKEHEALNQPLWKYLASLVYIALAFGASSVLDWVVNVWLRRLAAKTETKYDDLLLELLRGPVKVVAFVILLNIGLGVFDWPERAQNYIAHGFIVVVACSITYVALKVIDLLLGLWREKIVSPDDRAFAEHLLPFISKVAKTALIVGAVLLTTENLGMDIKTLIAGLSIGGLALGLAAQDTVANLFGAVAIFLDKPFHIGDRIRVDVVDGTVEAIGLRSTTVRSLDGHQVTIPNKLMGNAIITNVTRRPTIKTEMNLGLTYGMPAEKVRRATALLEEIFRANPRTADLIISFNKFADSALNIFVVHIWNGTDAKRHFAEMQALNLQIKERFDAENIEFAFPTQTVYVKSDAAK